MAIDIESNYVDCSGFVQTAASNTYISASYSHSSGQATMLPLPAESLDSPQHRNVMYAPSVNIKVTLPERPYQMDGDENTALWGAMKKSTKLVSRGRLVK